MLNDRAWQLRYTPEDGDLVKLFYIPALEDAERYHRLTGYFSASALALAARGIEGLVRNDGVMRLLVGCTLEAGEIEAIERGEALREQVEKRLAKLPLAPPDAETCGALELLAWMIGRGHLDVKVAVPCDDQGKPVQDSALFHEKAGIVEDRAGNRIAWNGSLNETAAGWQRNWESIHVYTSWGPEPARVESEEKHFAQLWANRFKNLIVLDVPGAVRQDLMRFMPEKLPKRLQTEDIAADSPHSEAGDRQAAGAPAQTPAGPSAGSLKTTASPSPSPPQPTVAPPKPLIDQRSLVWNFIAQAPGLPNGGAQVGEATAPVQPWPHQTRAFQRLYANWPPKLLIADEVGLGKTIQAGLLLRQAWLAGKAKRILILAPKAVLKQWQIELREKFNLNWPIYDGRQLVWQPSPGRAAIDEQEGSGERRHVERRRIPSLEGAVGEPDAQGKPWHRKTSGLGAHPARVANPQGKPWHEQPAVIASSQLMRRRERAAVLLEEAEPWDLIVLDEAHHARRRSAGAKKDERPNALLRLMRSLKERTQGLVLLTATPMQVHPIETWDLLELLGLPPEWSAEAFLQFFADLEAPNPSREAMERLSRLFRAVEREHGQLTLDEAQRRSEFSPLKARRVLRALRDQATTIPRRQLNARERRAALALMRAYTPIRHLVSRHTRQLLRRYAQKGLLNAPIAARAVEDRFLPMTAAERALYEAVEAYIANTYNQASAAERSAVGFVMTIYRRRVASSFAALRRTFEKRLQAMAQSNPAPLDAEEDAPDDETLDEQPDADELQAQLRSALAADEREQIAELLERARSLPPDSKLTGLQAALAELRGQGYGQAMVFTQFTDTMDFLREALLRQGGLRLMCFSGRGGEVPATDGATWRKIGRDDAKRRFRNGEADVLLCTDAAAEGLNFQFCGALVNYDMPWNPMRVEQRIGRIDRLGQRHPSIRIVNLHYEDTVETDVYRALRQRIQLFETVVGRLQPILAQLPRTIANAVLAKRAGSGGAKDANPTDPVVAIQRQTEEAQSSGFDLDAALDEAIAPPPTAPSPVAFDDLDRILTTPDLMPPDAEVQALGHREYGLRMEGMQDFARVTTDPRYYEENAESLELWSPGNPLFKPPDLLAEADEPPAGATLRDFLDS